jgi:hypothetical protein
MLHNTAAIRELLITALDDQALTTLCFDYFHDVYEDFAIGVSRLTKIQLLLEYCQKHERFDELLNHLNRINPYQYEKYITAIAEPLPIPRISNMVAKTQIEIVSTMELPLLKSELLFVLVRAFVGALAYVLHIPTEQVLVLKTHQSTLVLLLEMPTEATHTLMMLYDSQDPVIEDLGVLEVKMIDTPQVLGLISTSLSSESSQDEFYFWVDQRRLVEATQLVRVSMPLPTGDPRISRLGTNVITVIGIVEEVRRQSESRTLGADFARYDGLVDNPPLLPPTGFTYAHCRALNIEPLLFVPLTEGLPVYLASAEEAGRGYNYPAMEAAASDLTIGLLRNGGLEVAGAGKLDTRYVLGEFGGHVNVTGVAGTGTKTSFLMVLVKMLLLHAKATSHQDNPLSVVPIVFNVKGNDLMWLNCPNKLFDAEAADWEPYRRIWGDKLFGEFAQPFTHSTFYSYPARGGATKHGLPSSTKKYSWGLKDVIEWGAEKYLFSAESRAQELMQGVLEDAFQYISTRSASAPSGLTLDTHKVKDFSELVEWLKKAAEKPEKDDEEEDHHYLIKRQHDRQTIKAAARRLNNILSAARGVLQIEGTSGKPPDVTVNQNSDPIVIDIDGLEAAPQRFVVAAIIERVKQHREQNAERRQRYIIVLDELNRFVPRGSSDEISKLFEHVAAQLRSQGIILFGAQQKASNISPLVWENAATKALGRTGAVELAAEMWRQILPAAARTRAANLGSSEKIVLQDTFSYPMLVNIPFTPWATRKDEIGSASSANAPDILDSLDLGGD